MSEPLLQQTKAAICALSQPSETMNANAWLVEFEKSPSAWEVADVLLRDESNTTYSSSFRFFGAKFLYSKAQKQFFQLDAATAANLTQTLVQHIIRMSQVQGSVAMEMNVCRYLCLAVATLALQSNQAGIVSQILTWLNPIINSVPALLLELLIVLPEESYNRYADVSSETRNLFIEQLSNSSTDVLTFISSLWPTVNSKDKSKILLCAEKWVEITGISASILISQPIYGYILQTLQNINDPEIFEPAVDALLGILHRYQGKEMQVLESSLQIILITRAKWNELMKFTIPNSYRNGNVDEVDEDDINLCKVLCRLYTETAESCLDFFVSSAPNIGQNELISQLIECSRFSYIKLDANISKIPLKFFYELSMLVKYGSGSSDEETNRNNERSQLNSRYAPVYTCLLEIAIEQMTMPLTCLSGAVELPGDLVDMRLEWKETVLDCCYVLTGGSCLDFLCKQIQKHVELSSSQQMDWCRIESILFSILSIIPSLPKEEKTLLPQLISFLSGLPDELVVLQITVIEILGRLAYWFEDNPNFLPAVLQKLFRDLQTTRKCAASACSIMQLFRRCSGLPGIPVTELHSILVELRSSNILTIESELLLLEGIAVVISNLPPADAASAFKSIVLNTANYLNSIIASNNSPSSVNSSLIIPHIERLTVFFRYFRTEGTVLVELFVELIPLFKSIFYLNNTDKVSEKICRLYKHAIRSSGRKFSVYLPSMTQHLAEQFSSNSLAAFLYAGSICISDYSQEGNGMYIDVLYQMIWSMSTTFFSRFTSLEQFELKPDVVEEYFYMLAKALQFCPGPFVSSTSESNTVIQAGLTGLSLKHREAQKGILFFFERFVQLSTHWPENTQMFQVTRSVISSYAISLMLAIFIMLSGQMPAYALDESNGCISDVLWCLRRRFNNEFMQWLNQVFIKLPNEAQSIAKKQGMIESISNSAINQKDFSSILDRYESSCRQNI